MRRNFHFSQILLVHIGREHLRRQAATQHTVGAAKALQPAARRNAASPSLRQPPGQVELFDMSPEAGRRTGSDARSPAEHRCGCNA